MCLHCVALAARWCGANPSDCRPLLMARQHLCSLQGACYHAFPRNTPRGYSARCPIEESTIIRRCRSAVLNQAGPSGIAAGLRRGCYCSAAWFFLLPGAETCGQGAWAQWVRLFVGSYWWQADLQLLASCTCKKEMTHSLRMIDAAPGLPPAMCKWRSWIALVARQLACV